MTVKELIRVLGEFNPESDVVVVCENDSYSGHGVRSVGTTGVSGIVGITTPNTFESLVDLYPHED